MIQPRRHPSLPWLALLALLRPGVVAAEETGTVAARPTAARHRGDGAPRKPARNQPLRRTLVQMGREDQAEIEESFRNLNPPPNKAAHRQALLRQILAEHGWPGFSLAGEDGSEGAWLVCQHADEDLPLQRECLARLEEAHRKGEGSGRHLAYLTDRVRVSEKRPQLYGTQGSPVYDEVTRAAVNARRKHLGLPSMEETARKSGRLMGQAYRRAAATKATGTKDTGALAPPR